MYVFCRLNPHFIEIHTDPKAGDYVVVEGAKRCALPSDLLSAEELGVESIPQPGEVVRAASDPFYRVERAAPLESGKRGSHVDRLQALRDDRWQDDYASSQMLRRSHRMRRESDFLVDAERQAKGIRYPIRVAMGAAQLTLTPHEALEAATAGWNARRRATSAAEQKQKRQRLEILEGPLLPANLSMVARERAEALETRRARGIKIATPKQPTLKTQRASVQVVVGGAAVGGAAASASEAKAGLTLVEYSDSD